MIKHLCKVLNTNEDTANSLDRLDRNDGCAALHCAAHRGNDTVVRTLIDHEADVDVVQPSSTRTPPHCSAMQGHTKCTESLVTAGGVVDAPCSDGLTPFLEACFRGNLACAVVLAGAGADKTRVVPNVGQGSAVDLARLAGAGERRQGTLQWLQRTGNWRPAQVLADAGMHDLASWLLQRGRLNPALRPTGTPSIASITRDSTSTARAFWRRATGVWRPTLAGHSLFGPEYRATVHVLLLVEARLLRKVAGASHPPLTVPPSPPTHCVRPLPLELWHLIAGHLARANYDTCV